MRETVQHCGICQHFKRPRVDPTPYGGPNLSRGKCGKTGFLGWFRKEAFSYGGSACASFKVKPTLRAPQPPMAEG